VKIVIQSDCGPYGLSRRALEAVAEVLPARIVQQIDQLLVVANRWGVEPFEYDRKRRVAYSSYPGDSSDEEVRLQALRELLLALPGWMRAPSSGFNSRIAGGGSSKGSSSSGTLNVRRQSQTPSNLRWSGPRT
jgi:hypothetical protein